MAKHKHKPHHAHRNAATAPARTAPPPARPRRRLRRGPKPSLWTAASAVAGGLGGAALGAFANREGWDPRWVGGLMTAVGGLGAYKLDGNLRLASYGLAAAGAGDSLLKWLEKDRPATRPADREPRPADGARPKALANAARGPRQAVAGGADLDRAFNRVRERLHHIYEDDAEPGFVEEDVA